MAAAKKQPAAAEGAASPLIERHFVYMGVRMGAGDKKLIAIGLLAPGNKDEVDGDPLIFEWKRTRDHVVGGVYRGAKFSATQAAGLDRARRDGTWEDRGAVALWEAKEQAVLADLASRKLEADQKRVGEIQRRMLPMRRQYADLLKRYARADMEAMERAVMAALRTPPRSYE